MFKKRLNCIKEYDERFNNTVHIVHKDLRTAKIMDMNFQFNVLIAIAIVCNYGNTE